MNVLSKGRTQTKAQKKRTVRYLAMTILNAVEQEGAYVNLKLSHVLNDNTLSTEDSGLLTEMVYGVTQRRLTLDYLIDLHITQRIPLWVRNVLRLSAFQLLFLDKIPSYAILSEASDIVRMKAGNALVNMVRGIIYSLERDGKRQLEELYQLPYTPENMSIQYSAPVWLINYFVKHRGIDVTKALFESLLTKPALSVRTNGDISVIETLKSQFKTQPSQLVPEVALRILSGQVAKTELFEQGKITVQDETSMLVALAGNVQPSDIVLDACAAPGGKTTHIASFLKEGYVVSLDIHDHKLQLIRDNAKRLGVSDKVKEQLLDARHVHQTFAFETFDKVFVDAPCSGLGLMRRKPDIKYTKLLDSVSELSHIQHNILESVHETVKSQGLIIYSTCTLTKKENQEVVSRFLQKHDNFKILPLHYLDLPEKCYTKEGFIEIFPNDYQTDGFFIAVLQKD